MQLLLATNIVLPLANRGIDALRGPVAAIVDSPDNDLVVSAASVWEIAIKHRLGKLPLPCRLDQWPTLVALIGARLLAITAEHAMADVAPRPDTRDPIDRLLLAVCQADGMRLVTADAKLLGHPLAWRAPRA